MSRFRYPRTNLVIIVAFWSAVLGAIAWWFATPTLDDDRVFAAYQIVDSVHQEGTALRVPLRGRNTVVWIRTHDPEVRAALEGSDDTNRSIAWRIHLDGAFLVDDKAAGQYWAESFEYQGRTFGPFTAKSRWSWRELTPAAASLLRALADYEARHLGDAVEKLDAALGAGTLNRVHTIKAFDLRANALEAMAYPPGRELNDEDDALVARAIDDWRRAGRLAPKSFRIFMNEANATAMLGAYAESLEMFEEAGRRWPDEYFFVAMRTGAVRRQLGDHEGALRALDDLVARHGDQGGMMFHYHRGWTLNDLARYEEAIREFDAGLESQPDYPFALAARACSNAQLGRLGQALEDQKQAVQLHDRVIRALPKMQGEGIKSHELLVRVLEDLTQLQREAPDRPSAVACDRGIQTDPRSSRRERSRLYVEPDDLPQTATLL
jgi:tetratricopeptide (TPR) repeat protein